MSSPPVTIASGGAIETALLPYRLVHLLQHLNDLEVRAALSPRAEDMVSSLALEALTHNPVYVEDSRLNPRTGRPFHLDYADGVVVMYPATARMIAQCALGIIACPATRVFAFAEKQRVVVCPALHPRMDAGLYADHVKRLASLGCRVISGGAGLALARWSHVESAIADLTGAHRLLRPPEIRVADGTPDVAV